MLTIKQLADYVGVTVRAVRHYHAVGLLREPERDASGYRRYGTQDVADLVRIKALAEAGVPLARVQSLLRATPEEFARAVEDIGRRLQEEIERLQRARERVTTLASGDRLVLPEAVIGHLEALRAMGVSGRGIGMEREGWTVIAGRDPEQAAAWAAAKQQQLADNPDFRDLYLAFDRAFDLAPDDPRLVEVADRASAFLARVESGPGGSSEDEVSEHLVELLDAWVIPSSPAWRRLGQLIEERGWSRWTQVERAADRAG